MEQSLREDAEMIVKRALEAVKPDEAVRRCLAGKQIGRASCRERV